jgi:F-type H+-transporting ATPase subunit b
VDLLIPKMTELVPALISFIIILFVASKFVWPPITAMLLERAEAAKVEAERLLEEYKHTMAEARKEAGTILQQAKQAAESTRSDAATKAAAEYDEMIGKAREAIEGEKRAAIADLQKSVADLSIAVAGRLIAGELTRDDQLKVIEKYVAEAGSLNAN